MSSRLTSRTLSGTCAALALVCATALAGAPDPALVPWLGNESVIDTSSVNDHLPTGGKMTLVYDSDENVVRICTRSVAGQRMAWRMDLAVPCNVALSFTRGTRYCTLEDVKAGNAEVLSGCHRLRSTNVAMHPAAQKGAVELHDMIVFLLPPADGKFGMAIVLDSPSRVTHGGVTTTH